LKISFNLHPWDYLSRGPEGEKQELGKRKLERGRDGGWNYRVRGVKGSRGQGEPKGEKQELEKRK
jgi:hypothetical protein